MVLVLYQLLLQQYLPFTVLKPLKDFTWIFIHIGKVATVLTVYGIETLISRIVFRITILVVATVLTVYGIATIQIKYQKKSKIRVATVLTVYGIETILLSRLVVGQVLCCNATYHLRCMTKKLNNLIGIPHKHKKLYPRSTKVEFSSINLYNTMLIVSYICLIYN